MDHHQVLLLSGVEGKAGIQIQQQVYAFEVSGHITQLFADGPANYIAKGK